MARPDVRLVLLKGHIADIMQPILYPPVTPDELKAAIAGFNPRYLGSVAGHARG